MELLLEQTELRDSQPGRTRVYGLDLASGKKVWEYEAASPVTSCPAVAKARSSSPRPTAKSSASDNAKRQQLTASPQKEETFHVHSSSMQRDAYETSEDEEQERAASGHARDVDSEDAVD